MTVLIKTRKASWILVIQEKSRTRRDCDLRFEMQEKNGKKSEIGKMKEYCRFKNVSIVTIKIAIQIVVAGMHCALDYYPHECDGY